MKLIIIRGLPGSGKTTFIKDNYPNIFHIEADMLRVSNGIYKYNPDNNTKDCLLREEIAFKIIQHGADCIISGMFSTKRVINTLICKVNNLNLNNKLYIELIRLTGKYDSIHNVPEDIMKRYKLQFEDYDGETIINN